MKDKAILDYVLHRTWCAWVKTHREDTPCDCGLDQALTAALEKPVCSKCNDTKEILDLNVISMGPIPKIPRPACQPKPQEAEASEVTKEQFVNTAGRFYRIMDEQTALLIKQSALIEQLQAKEQLLHEFYTEGFERQGKQVE